jgi:hypothetical protein
MKERGRFIQKLVQPKPQTEKIEKEKHMAVNQPSSWHWLVTLAMPHDSPAP